MAIQRKSQGFVNPARRRGITGFVAFDHNGERIGFFKTLKECKWTISREYRRVQGFVSCEN